MTLLLLHTLDLTTSSIANKGIANNIFFISFFILNSYSILANHYTQHLHPYNPHFVLPFLHSGGLGFRESSGNLP